MIREASKGLLQAHEAAQYLATTERHLRRLVATDGLPVVHLRGKRRFRHADLDAYITRATVCSDRAEQSA